MPSQKCEEIILNFLVANFIGFKYDTVFLFLKKVWYFKVSNISERENKFANIIGF